MKDWKVCVSVIVQMNKKNSSNEIVQMNKK